LAVRARFTTVKSFLWALKVTSKVSESKIGQGAPKASEVTSRVIARSGGFLKLPKASTRASSKEIKLTASEFFKKKTKSMKANFQPTERKEQGSAPRAKLSTLVPGNPTSTKASAHSKHQLTL